MRNKFFKTYALNEDLNNFLKYSLSLSVIKNWRKIFSPWNIFKHKSKKYFLYSNYSIIFFIKFFDWFLFLCFKWTKNLITFQSEKHLFSILSISLWYLFCFINANENIVWFVFRNSFSLNFQMRNFSHLYTDKYRTK